MVPMLFLLRRYLFFCMRRVGVGDLFMGWGGRPWVVNVLKA